MLNRILDLVVDSPADFEVTRLQVPQENEGMTVAVLRLMGEDMNMLRQVFDDITKVGR